MPEIKSVTTDRNGVGESPVWDSVNQVLYWVDIPAGIIHRLSPASGLRASWPMGEPVGSIGLCHSGRLIVALRADVIFLDPENGQRHHLTSMTHAKPDIRLNDGKVGPDGAFWVGSMDATGDGNPSAKLYRFAADGSVEIVHEGFETSNGLAWDAAGTRMYHSDSRSVWIDSLDFDPLTGHATNRQRWRDATRDKAEVTGRPDGGACDIDGNYWSCGPSASRINRFSPSGDLLDWVDLPTLRPTMPCFGGPDMRTIYVTSLSSGIDADSLTGHPLCGTIVSFRAPVAGVPVSRFAD